ncbi:hypothetical protein D3C79_885850 [compost metagenome]
MAAAEHHLIGGTDRAAGFHHLPHHCIQAVDETVDPACHVATLVIGQGASVQALAQVALTLGDGTQHTAHAVQPGRQAPWPEHAEQQRSTDHAEGLDGVVHPLWQSGVMLHQVITAEQPNHGRHVGFHQPVAQRTAAIDLLQVGLAHHAPTVG